jgi:bifunctional ADP-heptose synthase (sugar kinase/adenylyltransferase)
MIVEKKEYYDFIKKKLHNKIDAAFFSKKNSPTILKKRFIDNITKSKLFGIYSINDDNISQKEDEAIIKYIEKIINRFDLIIISDYGHGFLSNKTALKICSKKKFIALNAQVNASNIGYHTLQKYKNVNATIINETELRHEMRNKNDDIFVLSKQLKKKLKTKNLLVTRGKNGAILLNSKNNEIIECPAFANNVVDRVGAGDSMLSIISLLKKIEAPDDLSLLLGSFAGAASVETMGNSAFLKKNNFLRNLEFALK